MNLPTTRTMLYNCTESFQKRYIILVSMINISFIFFIILVDTCSRLSSTECVACNCDTEGSSSTSCDSSGKCTCKTKYYGTKCNTRDCEMDNWANWSNCRCGHTDRKSRTRRIKTARAGEGLLCMPTTENGTCTMTPCNCPAIGKSGYYGDRCEKRDCVLTQWSSWTGSNCPGCPDRNRTFKYCYPRSSCPSWSTQTPKRSRSRSIQTSKVGGGRDCGPKSETSGCGYKCQQYCQRLYQKRPMFWCYYKRYSV